MMVLIGGGLVSFWGPLRRRRVLHPRPRSPRRLHRNVAALVRAAVHGDRAVEAGRARGARPRSRRPRAREERGTWRCSKRVGLHKRFGDRVVLEEIDLAFEAGSLTGIMGPNGAGKTTCFNCLTGMYAPDRGEIRLDGRSIGGLAPAAVTRLGVARSFQAINLFDDDTALDNLARRAAGDARALVRCLARPRARRRARRTRRQTILERVGLRGRERVRARDLAYGERRALEIGLALATRPAHPVPGRADVRAGRRAARRACAELVRELKRALTLVIIEHDMTLPVRPGGLRQRHPLGAGDRARHAGRAARQSVGAALRARSARMLSVRAIDTYYGESQVLFGVSLRRRARRGRRAARPERRRQDDDAALDPGTDACARAARSSSRPQRDALADASRSRASGIGWVPDDRRVFPTLTAARNLSIARKRIAVSAPTPTEACCEIFPALRNLLPRECENMSGGELQMVSISRALVGAPGPRAVRRAEPGTGAQGRAGRDAHDPRLARGGRRRARGRPERAHRARRRRPRVRACMPAASCTRAPPRRCATTAARAARRWAARGVSAHGASRDRSVLHVEGLVKRYYRSRAARASPRSRCAADFAVEGAADHRRARSQRVRQDDAVRAHHRQQRAERGTRAGRRPRHPPRALPRARPARHPLSPVVPGARIPQDAARVAHGTRPGAPDRSCTCSTSRSSRSRTATSASCSTSSARLRDERQRGVPVRAPERAVPSRHPARSRASASCSCTRGASPNSRTSCADGGRSVRTYLGGLAPGLPESSAPRRARARGRVPLGNMRGGRKPACHAARSSPPPASIGARSTWRASGSCASSR